ncbi:MAG: hypothetical protein AAGE94_06540 [Acidobacteriota bacterium]
MSVARRRRLSWAALAAIGVLAVWAGCSAPDADRASIASTQPEVVHRGPVVLVTFANLRADLVASTDEDGSAWTPTLDALYDGLSGAQSWRGVSASSSPVPALASLVFGVDPWHHGVLSHADGDRRRALPSLGSALAVEGYSTVGYLPRRAGFQRYGVVDGFDAVHDLGDGSAARAELAELDGSARFVWIHVPVANPPLLDHRQLVSRLAKRPAVAPIDSADLLPYADPERSLPDELAAAAWELYRQEAAWGDQLLDSLLESIAASGRADETLLVVTALHGCEFGEHGQALFAQNLGRESIEVPLVVRLPPTFSRRLAEHGPWVSTPRIWSTLVEAVGGEPAPIHLPSLFHRSTLPVFSSLFAQGSRHRFSVLEDDGDGAALQLRWSTQFADDEPEYYALQAAEAQSRRRDHRPSRLMRARLARALDLQPPLSGIGTPVTPELTLERWPIVGGFEALADREAEQRLATTLRDRFLRFVDRERSRRTEDARRRIETPKE